MALALAPVLEGDLEEMAALRVDVLQESLERLGRFDPTRARDRLVAGFVPAHMRHVLQDQRRVGYITLRPPVRLSFAGRVFTARHLDHLYICKSAQSSGVGAWVLGWAKRQAVGDQCDIVLSALKQSAANRFYLRHGFVQVGESEFDLDYRWIHATGSAL